MDDIRGFDPRPGLAEEIAPGLRRILAPNPSAFTFRGTNTYLVGSDSLAVIDPGPDIDAHLDAILAAAGGRSITHILVTHAHLDHSALAPRLAQAAGAPVLAYGDAHAGRSRIMSRLAGDMDGGEGLDTAFTPDVRIADGEVVEGADWRLEAIWTPGHLGNHLAFDMEGILFTGDLVMGWSTSIVSPPDGDLTDFMASCERLRTRPARLYLPGHGGPVHDPQSRLDWLIDHRRAREASILNALQSGPADPETLTRRVYTDIDPRLLPAAARNVLAHLVDLVGRNLVRTDEPLTAKSVFSLT